MGSFKIAVASVVAVVMLLPFLTHASPTDATNNSKPYCNITSYFPRTSMEEVSRVIMNAVAELNNMCNENKVVSKK